MILLGFLITLLVLSLGKLFLSIDKYKSVTKVEPQTIKSGRQFDELTFYDSKQVFVSEGK